MSFFATGLHGPTFARPWQALHRLQREVDGLFGQAAPDGSLPRTAFPALNVHETPDEFVVTAELPGLRFEEIEVHVDRSRLTLRGERKIGPAADGEVSVLRRERRSGAFERSLELPVELDGANVRAVYRNGILLVRLPKAPTPEPRRVPVQSAS